MYYESRIYVGEMIEVTKTYHQGMIGGFRRRTGQPTTERQQRYNDKLRVRKLYHLLRMNFCGGDTNVSLHYKRGMCPPDERTAKKDIAETLRRIKRKYPDSKYIYSTHTTDRGSIHHHLILTKDVPFYLIAETWRAVTGGSISNGSFLYEDKNTYKKLAAYLLGLSQNMLGDEKNHTRAKYTRGYTGSRNLMKPSKEYREVQAKTWRKQPPVPNGYRIAELINGKDLFDMPFQHYILVPVDSEYTEDEDGGDYG